MRLVPAFSLLLLPLAFCLAGCQTDQQGVMVNVSALARAYGAGVDKRPSREQLDRVIEGLPAPQLTDLGVMYEREGNLDRAAWAYQQAIRRDLRYAPAYVNLGNVLRSQHQTEAALLRYRQALSADPRSFDAANNLADLCASEGIHLDEAIGRLEPLLESAGPHRAYGLDTLGWLYHLRGDEARAIALLELALAEAPGNDLALLSAISVHLAEARSR
jgi:Tfp pilus assembly protein PilF